jgi:hypothetical protein
MRVKRKTRLNKQNPKIFLYGSLVYLKEKNQNTSLSLYFSYNHLLYFDSSASSALASGLSDSIINS